MASPIPAYFASDLEGVLIPEIWIGVAKKTGIEKLFLTTREVSDYDALMRMRLQTLREHNLTIHDVQQVIASMDPLPGAREFVNWVRSHGQFVIITDSFYEFVHPFLAKLDYPTVFAHSLQIDDAGVLTGYQLRQQNGKQKAIEALRSIGFRTMAWGDSYNDITMLKTAGFGVLYNPPDNVVADFPNLPVTHNYDELKAQIERFLASKIKD